MFYQALMIMGSVELKIKRGWNYKDNKILVNINMWVILWLKSNLQLTV